MQHFRKSFKILNEIGKYQVIVFLLTRSFKFIENQILHEPFNEKSNATILLLTCLKKKKTLTFHGFIEHKKRRYIKVKLILG